MVIKRAQAPPDAALPAGKNKNKINILCVYVCPRSFVFLSIVAISMLESSAFTIRRMKDVTVKLEQDLVGEGSSLVDVKEELPKANNIKVIDLQNTSLEKIVPGKTTAKVYEIKGDYPGKDEKIELTTAYIVLKTDDGYLKITGLPVYTSSVNEDTSSIAITYVPDKNEEVLRQRRQKSGENEITTATNAFTTSGGNDEAVSTQPSETSQQISTAEIRNILSDIISQEVTTVEIPSEIATAVTDYTSGVPTIESKSTRRNNSSSINLSQATGNTANIKLPTTSIINSSSRTIDKLNSTGFDEPIWKKYNTINRKPEEIVTDSIIATHENIEGTTKEDAPARVTLEKVLNETPISSLEALKEEMLSNTNTYKSIQMQTDTYATSTMQPAFSDVYISESDKLTSSLETKRTSPRIRHSSSKRAGFLDYSAKPIADNIAEEATTIIDNYDTTSITGNENLSTTFEFEVQDSDSVLDSKKEAESQRQLAEDAIKEELLKEELLSDNEEYAKRYRLEAGATINRTTDILTLPKTNQQIFDDNLSVKPINYEKVKNPVKYTVSPNYKPLKKIEVQSQKPVLRDPDDNSWRNESISSLGIVFKPKAASKNYTEVLRNKTEALLSGSLINDNKNDVPDLKERLEKITEVRKSKKKKVIDKFGEPVYSDYDEAVYSVESISPNTPPLETTSVYKSVAQNIIGTLQSTPSVEPELTTYTSNPDQLYIRKDINKELDGITTEKPKKYNSVLEYYDTTDEYDVDYLNLAKLDLKKYTPGVLNKETPISTVPSSGSSKPAINTFPERKPTIQYFPPRVTQKVNFNEYNEDFQRKVNSYPHNIPKNNVGLTFTTIPTQSVPRNNYDQYNKKNTIIPSNYNSRSKPATIEKNVHTSNDQRVPGALMQNNGYAVDTGTYDRGSYVIRHYKDFIDEASRDNDYDRNAEYIPYTEAPLRGVTLNNVATLKDRPNVDAGYDYETQFRKDILNRFVDNFNQNNERFKVDFPILYNNSVLHRKTDESGKVLATSTAFMKRLYGEGNTATKANNYVVRGRPCENCDNITVELSPAYELHYYVPEQEEREEAEPRSVTLAYRYTL
ncbi:uncharacterized protein LOC131841016 [Achroia grisella]|uniref:uncharacterized protein LOC131841016 n=1 Tax=Achroia grisella TaxID=688607 RepID=UPI0027D2AE33|nr:uncharacterized protein LOC131841016 [Achroia grisella]